MYISLVPRLSFSEGRKEPGNIEGVKPRTSATRLFAEPIRLQNENTRTCDYFAGVFTFTAVLTHEL